MPACPWNAGWPPRSASPRSTDLPLAAASLRGEGVDPGEACWLHADPVHLKVQRDHLILADARCFEIPAQEAADMLGALNAHFRQDGIEFVAPVPQRWYVRVRDEALIRTTPTAEVIGRSIEGFLPAGDDAPRWRRLASEAQMLLHQPSLQRCARRARGASDQQRMVLGRRPHARCRRTSPYGAVWSSHPLAAGLAARRGSAGAGAAALSAELVEIGHDQGQDRPVLVVLEQLRAPPAMTCKRGAARWQKLEAHLVRAIA